MKSESELRATTSAYIDFDGYRTRCNYSMTNSSYLSNSFFKKIVPVWNNFPPELKTKKWTYDTIKARFKDFFQDKFKHQIDTPEFDKKCWTDYQFL